MNHTKGPWRYGWDTTKGVTGPRAAPGVYLGLEIRQMPIHVSGEEVDCPVAWVLTADKDDDLEADARLISAAPELLEALQERIDNDEQTAFEDWLRVTSPSGDVDSVHQQWEGSSLFSDFIHGTAKARAAIAKALGAQQ